MAWINPMGYVMVQLSGGKIVKQHRMVMEKYLGRKLMPSEAIHHINFDRTYNRIENLRLMTHSAHSKLHAAINIPPREYIFQKCFGCGNKYKVMKKRVKQAKKEGRRMFCTMSCRTLFCNAERAK